jgi:hypothetical protein
MLLDEDIHICLHTLHFWGCLNLYIEVKFSMHLKPPTAILGKCSYPSLGSFEVSQQESWHPNGSSTW